MCGAAILDFAVGVGNVLPTFWVENPTSVDVLVEISDFPVRLEHIRNIFT